MITKAEVLPLFHRACPSFAPRWQEHCAAWDEEHLLYIDLGVLVDHIVDRFAAGHTEEFPAVFAVCERLHLEGDPEVREAATIGLLEGIQNVSGSRGVDPEEFRQFLGPESLKWWTGLNAFWDGRSRVVCPEQPGES